MTNKPKKGTAEAKPALTQRIRKYFEELRYEWQKITFPSRKELVQSTIVVFIFTILLMLIISAYDWLVSFLFNKYILPPVTG